MTKVLDTTTRFDRLVSRQGVPEHFRDAAVELNDTLELCWESAQAIFGNLATPDHAISLLPLFMAHADAKRQQREDEIRGSTDHGDEPAPKTPSQIRRRGSAMAR